VNNTSGTGLWIDGRNHVVTNNTFSHNTGFGIYSIGHDCRFYYNHFSDNEAGNAYDNGHSNGWDDGAHCGNEWDDYSGSGVYSIPGDAESVDHHPIYSPTAETSNTSSNTDTSGLDPFLLSISLLPVTVSVILAVLIVRNGRRQKGLPTQ
jgi:hypothetical protein